MDKTKHTFFCLNLDDGYLNEEESAHAMRVLRLKSGDKVRIVDGKGKAIQAELTEMNKKVVSFKVLEELQITHRSVPVHIAIAPTKNMDRFSFFLEKVTEMGCAEITPIYTANSERKSVRTDKGKKVMIAALKQSGNFYLPKLNEPLSFKDLLDQNLIYDQKLIAHCDSKQHKIELQDVLENGRSVLILIGPEGDFSPEEVILAEENGFLSVSLGEARFRTETAGIVVCHTAYLYL